MAERYRTSEGWTVEVVRPAEGERLRIRHHRFHVADVVNVDDPSSRPRPRCRGVESKEVTERSTLNRRVRRPRRAGRGSAGCGRGRGWWR
jgi:hypothetical protein